MARLWPNLRHEALVGAPGLARPSGLPALFLASSTTWAKVLQFAIRGRRARYYYLPIILAIRQPPPRCRTDRSQCEHLAGLWPPVSNRYEAGTEERQSRASHPSAFLGRPVARRCPLRLPGGSPHQTVRPEREPAPARRLRPPVSVDRLLARLNQASQTTSWTWPVHSWLASPAPNRIGVHHQSAGASRRQAIHADHHPSPAHSLRDKRG